VSRQRTDDVVGNDRIESRPIAGSAKCDLAPGGPTLSVGSDTGRSTPLGPHKPSPVVRYDAFESFQIHLSQFPQQVSEPAFVVTPNDTAALIDQRCEPRLIILLSLLIQIAGF